MEKRAACFVLFGAVTAVAIVVPPLAAAASEAQGAVDVLVEEFVFQPSEVEIVLGGTVTWTIGADPEQHTVTPRTEGAFDDSGPLFPGDTYALTFDSLGTVEYFCRYHPNMTGTVTVVAPVTPAAATRSPSPTATASASAVVSASPPASPAAMPPPGDPLGGSAASPLLVAAAAAVGAALVITLFARRRM